MVRFSTHCSKDCFADLFSCLRGFDPGAYQVYYLHELLQLGVFRITHFYSCHVFGAVAGDNGNGLRSVQRAFGEIFPFLMVTLFFYIAESLLVYVEKRPCFTSFSKSRSNG